MSTTPRYRLLPNYVYGYLTDNLLTGGGSPGTTMNSPGLSSAPGSGGSPLRYFPVVLDPQSQIGAPEIVWVNGHTTSATTATVLRAQEGTAARAHSAGEYWVSARTQYDDQILNTRVSRSTVLALPANTLTIVPWNALNPYDSLGGAASSGMGALPSTTFTAPVAGWYAVSLHLEVTAALQSDNRMWLYVNGSIWSEDQAYNLAGVYAALSINEESVYLAVGDSLQVQAQNLTTAGSIVADNTLNYFSVSLRRPA